MTVDDVVGLAGFALAAVVVAGAIWPERDRPDDHPIDRRALNRLNRRLDAERRANPGRES